jgi:hypothetical protein
MRGRRDEGLLARWISWMFVVALVAVAAQIVREHVLPLVQGPAAALDDVTELVGRRR